MEKSEPPLLPNQEIDFESLEGIDEENAVPICISCMAEIPHDQVLFCPNCGAPIDSIAAILYFESTLAEGFVLREACWRPRNRMTVIGMAFLMGIVSVGFWVIIPLSQLFGIHPSFGFVALPAIIYPLMMFRCLRSYREFRQKEKSLANLQEFDGSAPEIDSSE